MRAINVTCRLCTIRNALPTLQHSKIDIHTTFYIIPALLFCKLNLLFSPVSCLLVVAFPTLGRSARPLLGAAIRAPTAISH